MKRRKNAVLAVDIGTSSLKAGEFEFPADGSIQLNEFAWREYEEELTEGTRSVVISDVLRSMLQEHNFSSRRTLLTVSGQSVFTRFVKLPPVAEEEGRVRQIVEFEARQNVPFPLEEVTWSYQLLSVEDTEELEVMFVVIKNEILEDVSHAVESVGLDLELIDVAPTACYNAARGNGIGDDGCSIILDIGCRSTNLLFADRTRFFSRTIPIAGHSISQQIAKEFGINFSEAEELKKRHGFVALGGAYEEPDSEVAASVSKIIRNVMTRLHGEVNRSINVYRAQKKGSNPVGFYLAGGSSIMAYTDRFFSEKLNMDVRYLNPFPVIKLGPEVNRQELQEAAHMFSQTVGLALRYRSRCPIEVSLLPKTIRKQKTFRRKEPYVAGGLLCVIVMLLFQVVANRTMENQYKGLVQQLSHRVERLKGRENEITRYQQTISRIKKKHNGIKEVFEMRTRWPHIFNELRRLAPPYMWFYEITPLTEIKEDERASREEEPDEAGGGDIFGPGGTGGAGGFGREEEKEKRIIGLRLAGHSVVVNPRLEDRTEELGRTPELKEDSMPEGEGAPTDGGGFFGNGADDADGEDADGSEAESEAGTADQARRNLPPEEAFVYSLRKSDLFEESSATNIETYSTAKDYPNLSSFVIQAKLNDVIEP